MAYSVDLTNSARRHWEAAERLYAEDGTATPRNRDVAGYLYGVAGECALKQLMRRTGMRPLPPEQRRDDPFYAHFPQLKTMLRETLNRRNDTVLRRWADDQALMNEWDTDMRYAPRKDVRSALVDRWRDHARQLVEAMESAL